MREIILTPRFKRAFRKFIRNNRRLQNQIEKTLKQMQQDVYNPDLNTHKLGGELAGFRACSCGYDCRIVFLIEKKQNEENKEMIVLIDIGTHDEIY